METTFHYLVKPKDIKILGYLKIQQKGEMPFLHTIIDWHHYEMYFLNSINIFKAKTVISQIVLKSCF